MDDLRAAKRVGYIAGYGLAVVSATGNATPYQDVGHTPWSNFCPAWIDDADRQHRRMGFNGNPHTDAFKEAFFEGVKDGRNNWSEKLTNVYLEFSNVDSDGQRWFIDSRNSVVDGDTPRVGESVWNDGDYYKVVDLRWIEDDMRAVWNVDIICERRV